MANLEKKSRGWAQSLRKPVLCEYVLDWSRLGLETSIKKSFLQRWKRGSSLLKPPVDSPQTPCIYTHPENQYGHHDSRHSSQPNDIFGPEADRGCFLE